MRKIAYVVGSIILTGCGGGGGDSPSSTPTANNTPVTTASVAEKPYFTEVLGAFPDPTNHYWFFNLAKPANTHSGKLNAVISKDLNNDGTKELILVIHKGLGHDTYRGMFVGEPCKTTTVIYTLNGDRFIDVSDVYLDKDRDFKACMGDSNASVADVNNDGKPDMFFSANQEDGRNPDLGSYMTSQLVGWVSQSDGKYKIMRFGPEKWYHSVGHGVDDSGNVFIAGAGYPNREVQNNRYIWDGRGLQTIYDYYFPNISPVTFAFLSRNSKSSNLLIQHTWDTQMGAVGYYKENNIWYKTNLVSPDVQELSEETFKLWSGDTKKINVLKVEGHHVAGGGGGSNLENLVSCNINNDSTPLVVGTYTLAVIPNYTPGKVIDSNEIDAINMPVVFDIKDKKLVMSKINIKGETNFGPGKFQCLDVNKDGYDDLSLGLGNDDDIRHQRIYINQKDGSFKKLSFDNINFMSLNNRVDMYLSHMDDFDNDGIMDVIVAPSNHVDNSSLNGTLKFYRGTKAIQ
jgi:hypothetical protein